MVFANPFLKQRKKRKIGMMLFSRMASTLALAALAATGTATLAEAAPKTDFKVAWSIYVGWMP